MLPLELWLKKTMVRVKGGFVGVWQMVVQAVLLPEARNKNFDAISKEEGEGEPTKDFAAFFSSATAGI